MHHTISNYVDYVQWVCRVNACMSDNYKIVVVRLAIIINIVIIQSVTSNL